jgi:hypothetical protein
MPYINTLIVDLRQLEGGNKADTRRPNPACKQCFFTAAGTRNECQCHVYNMAVQVLFPVMPVGWFGE